MNGSAYDVHPYLLLNLSDKYDGLTTYAHEWGHAMHSMLANRAQPYETAQYPTFIAEIASTCQEALLARYMLAHATRRSRRSCSTSASCSRTSAAASTARRCSPSSSSPSTRSPRRARARRARASPRSISICCAAITDRRWRSIRPMPMEWAFIPHFYFGFYVFQYATSITASTYFAEKVLTGGAGRTRPLSLGAERRRFGLWLRYPEEDRPRYGDARAVPGGGRGVRQAARPGGGAAGLTVTIRDTPTISVRAERSRSTVLPPSGRKAALRQAQCERGIVSVRQTPAAGKIPRSGLWARPCRSHRRPDADSRPCRSRARAARLRAARGWPDRPGRVVARRHPRGAGRRRGWRRSRPSCAPSSCGTGSTIAASPISRA